MLAFHFLARALFVTGLVLAVLNPLEAVQQLEPVIAVEADQRHSKSGPSGDDTLHSTNNTMHVPHAT